MSNVTSRRLSCCCSTSYASDAATHWAYSSFDIGASALWYCMLSLVSSTQVADQVRLVLVLLEIELVGAAEHLPVDVPQVVAGRVLAMLGKLDREPVVRAAMHARDVPFDDPRRPQLQAFEFGQHSRVEKVGCCVGHGLWINRRGHEERGGGRQWFHGNK